MRNSGARSFAGAVVLIPALSTVLVQAATLPDGPGKVETTRVCGKCHTLDLATSLRQAEPGWTDTISKMVNLGAEGSEAEFTAVLNYLVKNFGGRNQTPQASDSSPSAIQPPADASTPKPESKVARDRKEPAVSHSGQPIPATSQWPTYGHDPGGQRFSPLAQITPANVGRLKIAWTFHMRAAGSTGRGGGPTAGEVPELPGGGGGGRRGMFGSGFRTSGNTPLV